MIEKTFNHSAKPNTKQAEFSQSAESGAKIEAKKAARRRLDSLSRHRGAESRYRHRDNRATTFPYVQGCTQVRAPTDGSALGLVTFFFCKKKVTETGKGRVTPFDIIA